MKLREKVEIELSISRKMWLAFKSEIDRKLKEDSKDKTLDTYYECLRDYEKQIRFLEELLKCED